MSSQHAVEIKDHEAKEADGHSKSSAPVPARDVASGLEDGEEDADERHQKKSDGERGPRFPGTRAHEGSAWKLSARLELSALRGAGGGPGRGFGLERNPAGGPTLPESRLPGVSL